MNARRGPAFYRVSNLDGEQVGEAAEFSNDSLVVSLYDAADDAPPEVFDDLDAARRGTSGVVFEARRGPTRPGEREVSLRWNLPENTADSLTLYRHDAIIHALVETAIADDPALDVPEDVFETCDVLRVSAYRVGIMPTGPLAETALPESVEVVEPIADGGRSFSTQPETCPDCGLTLDTNGECKTNGCPGPE